MLILPSLHRLVWNTNVKVEVLQNIQQNIYVFKFATYFNEPWQESLIPLPFQIMSRSRSKQFVIRSLSYLLICYGLILIKINFEEHSKDRLKHLEWSLTSVRYLNVITYWNFGLLFQPTIELSTCHLFVLERRWSSDHKRSTKDA